MALTDTSDRFSDLGLWVEHRGQGADVLLIAGLGDPVEAGNANLTAWRTRIT